MEREGGRHWGGRREGGMKRVEEEAKTRKLLGHQWPLGLSIEQSPYALGQYCARAGVTRSVGITHSTPYV